MHNTFTSIVTPLTALMVFMGVLIVSFIIANFCTPTNFDQTRTKIFITCLAGFGVIITFLFYYGVVTLQQQQQRQAIITMTSNINKLLLKGIIDQKASDNVPYFTASLFPLLGLCDDNNSNIDTNDSDNTNSINSTDSKMNRCKATKDKDCVENKLLIFKLSYKIFSLWQELIIAMPFLDIENTSFVSNFLQRANSPILYEQWQLCKLDFNQETQRFGDLLFHYALPIKIHTPDVYVKTAHQLCNDQIYKDIMVD